MCLLRQFIVQQELVVFQFCDLRFERGNDLWIRGFNQTLNQSILLLIQLLYLAFKRRFSLCYLFLALP
ncbi:hypothetical protein BWR17_15175 [Phaeobacter inhibens]|nr:hypothetical protein BWR17_15175 [Phaeobacter inhibens]